MSEQNHNEPTPEEPQPEHVEPPKQEAEAAVPEPNTPEDVALPTDDDEVDDGKKDDVPWTPESTKVDFNEERPTRDTLDDDTSLKDCIKIVAESQQVIAQVVEKHSEMFKGLSEWVDELYRTRRSDVAENILQDTNPWFHAFQESFQHASLSGVGDGALVRDGSEWRQVVDAEGMPLRPGMPKQRLSGTNHSLDERISYLKRRSGFGTTFDVPLYHSGIWVRLKSPSLAELAQLQEQLAQTRVNLGYQTKGMAFANAAQAISSEAVDFALQFVTDANIHYSTPSDLKEHILLLDLPVLLWGLAVTMWPKGFAYAHPCLADPKNCSHITKVNLNLNRLLWTDTVSLSKTQRAMMASKFSERLTEDDLKRYRGEHVRGNERTVWFEEMDIGLVLKVPTLQHYEDEGRNWIEGIVEMTHGMFNEPPHGKNRENYILKLGAATQARQYSHWVKEIVERDPEEGAVTAIADDEMAINEILSHVFSTEEFSNRFFNEVVAFMDSSTLSVVALPSFNCPACNNPQAETFKERFDHLIIMDVLTTFFTLVHRKLR